MLATPLRALITGAGETPVSPATIPLLRQLVTLYGGTPTQYSIVGLLKEAVTASGGTPTKHDITSLLRELITARGGTPVGISIGALGNELADLGIAPPFDSGLIDNGGFDSDEGWTLAGGAAISDSHLTIASGATADTSPNTPILADTFYRITLNVASRTGSAGATLTFSFGGVSASTTAAGQVIIVGYSGSAPPQVASFIYSGISGDTFVIDDVRVEGPLTYSLSAEIVSDPTFDNPSAWTAGTNTSVTGGQGVFAAAATNTNLTNTTPTEGIIVDAWYRISLDIISHSGGFMRPVVGGTSAGNYNTTGTKTATIKAALTTSPQCRAFQSTTSTIDNFSVKRFIFDS